MKTESTKGPRKQTGVRVDEQLVVEMRVLALRERKGFNELMEEAMQDLLRKYAAAKKRA